MKPKTNKNKCGWCGEDYVVYAGGLTSQKSVCGARQRHSKYCCTECQRNYEGAASRYRSRKYWMDREVKGK